MGNKPLKVIVVSKITDCFNVTEVSVLINGKEYTYPITSEFAVRKVESLIKRKRYGKAIKVLNLFVTTGFNSFKEEHSERGA